MSYDPLPLEERIQKAAGYSLLLSQDPRPRKRLRLNWSRCPGTRPVSPGFVLGIGLLRGDSVRMRNRQGDVIPILNLVVKGRRLYNYEHRNKAETENAEAFFGISS
jgi:hypothetical protein